MQTRSTSSENRPRRPYSASASDRPTKPFSPTEPALSSYSFPPAPRTADGLSTFTTSDHLPPFAPRVENSPEPEFSFQPPFLSHFLSTGNTSPHPNESRDQSQTVQACVRGVSPEPTRFSTLGQAIYDGQDPRQVLSSFSFAKLITPYAPHEHHLPTPPPPSRPTRCRRPEWEYDQLLPPPPAQFHRRSPSGLAPPIRINDSPVEPPLVPTRRDVGSGTTRPRQRASYSFPSPLPLPRRLDSPIHLHDTDFDRSRQSSYETEEEELVPSLSFPSQPRKGLHIHTSDSSSFSFRQSTEPSYHKSTSTTPSLSPEQSKRPFRGTGTSPNSRSVVGFYRPSPQSMLAPEAVREVNINQSLRGKAPRGGRAWNAPLIPDGIDFDSLPTKSSRGRKPPTAPNLGLGAAETTSSESVTGDKEVGSEGGKGEKGNGKGKKVWLCKVKGCEKVFKRGEHLQRHVRSIHTGEKPFQCAFPSCGKLFSRHDNLNQHLRVHRSPNQTVEEFSAQVAACFNRRLAQIEQETQEIARKAQAEKEAAERKRKAEEARESIYVPPRPIRAQLPPSSNQYEAKEKESRPSKKRRRASIGLDSSSSGNTDHQSESIGFVAPAPARGRVASASRSSASTSG
ncbi:hypothetical protein JCM5350_007599 [Sporobolomyces pararoseus]